jgi:hypothetical protein
VVALQGGDAIQQAIRAFPENGELQHAGLVAIHNMLPSKNGEVPIIVLEIVAAVTRHAKVEEVPEIGCKLLRKLAESGHGKSILDCPQWKDAVLNAMAAFPQQRQVQSDCISVIHKVLTLVASSSPETGAEFVPVVVQAITAFSGDAAFLVECCPLLVVLANKGHAETLVNLGIVGFVTHAMRTNGSIDTELILGGCQVLEALALSGPVRPVLLQSGGHAVMDARCFVEKSDAMDECSQEIRRSVKTFFQVLASDK